MTALCSLLICWVGRPKQLADHLGGKYRIEYLTNVCEGRPIGDVERDVVRVLTHGLADKLACSIMASRLPDSERVGQAARRAFIRIARRFDLHLREITRLAEIGCSNVTSAESFRTQTIGTFDVDYWESFFGNIARNLSQGELFQSEHASVDDLEWLSLSFDRTTSLEQAVGKPTRTDSYVMAPLPCWFCRHPTEKFTTSKCDRCGRNWNIPD